MFNPPKADIPSRSSITPGTTIVVGRNQNVYRIAQKYGVSMRDIIALNELKEPFALREGQRLILPAKRSSLTSSAPPPMAAVRPTIEKVPLGAVPLGAASSNIKSGTSSSKLPDKIPFGAGTTDIGKTSQSLAMAEDLPEDKSIEKNTQTKPLYNNDGAIEKSAATADNAESSSTTNLGQSIASTNTTTAAAKKPVGPAPSFVWPVEGNISSTFGAKGQGLGNDGINIAAPRGSPVVASAAGIVVHSDEAMKGFGKMVLIRHEGGWITAYGHLDKIFVDKDTVVATGDMIGTVGSTGTATSPQLHFETRLNGKPVNPESRLPKRDE